jgi:hypothetical protein
VIRRTSLNLDLDLVQAAKAVLHTVETTETIHRALADVVRHDRLRRLTERRFELADEELVTLRRSRTAESPPISVNR